MGRKQTERPSSGENESPMLKMKEIMDATGVTKATILHYVKEGLLPEPVKTGRNMACRASLVLLSPCAYPIRDMARKLSHQRVQK